MRLRLAVWMWVCLVLPAAASPPSPMRSLDYFVGQWDCAGVFPASGKTIASRMTWAGDLDGAALVKHHEDKPPSGYRAIEAWGYDPGAGRFNATILANGGSTRRLASDGWKGDVFTWSVIGDAGPAQQFVYVRVDADHYRVDWKIARDGKALVVGDTLTCRRLH